MELTVAKVVALAFIS